MPFKVTDKVTGKTLRFENRPTDMDLQEAFGSLQTPEEVTSPEQPTSESQPEVGKILGMEYQKPKGSFKEELIDSAKGMAGQIVGIPEVAANIATGVISAPASYVAKVGATALYGGEKGEEVGREVSQALTYQPQTQYAKEVIESTGKAMGSSWNPFTWPSKTGKWLGRKIDKATNNETRDWEVGLENVGEAPLQALGMKYGLREAGVLKKYDKNFKVLDSQIDKDVSKIVRKDFNKIFKPTAKKKFSQMQGYEKRVGSAERWLAENKDILKYTDETGEITQGHVPQTAIQNAQAWDQALKIIWDRAEELSKKQTGVGIHVEMTPLIRQLKGIAEKNKTASPNVTAEANALIARLQEAPVKTLPQVTDELAQINLRQSAKTNPAYSEYGNMQVDATYAKYLREQLYGKVEGIGELRDLMADFKTAEPQVLRAAQKAMNIDTNKMDFLDIGATAAASHAIFTGNVSAGFSAAILEGMNRIRHLRKNINRQIKGYYKDIDKAVDKGSEQNAISKIFGKGGKGLPQEELRRRQIGYTPRMDMESEAGVVRETSNVPPLTRPTTKALPYDRATTPMQMGMKEVSGVPKPDNYTVKEWNIIEEKLNKAVETPDFARKNPEIYNLVAEYVQSGKNPPPFTVLNNLIRRAILKEAPKPSLLRR